LIEAVELAQLLPGAQKSLKSMMKVYSPDQAERVEARKL